jgi:hypothetical protein
MTAASPEWLQYVWPAVALAALLLAIAPFATARSSLKTARATYGRAGSLVTAQYSVRWDSYSPITSIHVWNAGLSPISLDHFELFYEREDFECGDSFLLVPMAPTEPPVGAQLPFSIAGQS